MERIMDGRKGGLEWIVRGMDGWMDRWKGGEGRKGGMQSVLVLYVLLTARAR